MHCSLTHSYFSIHTRLKSRRKTSASRLVLQSSKSITGKLKYNSYSGCKTASMLTQGDSCYAIIVIRRHGAVQQAQNIKTGQMSFIILGLSTHVAGLFNPWSIPPTEQVSVKKKEFSSLERIFSRNSWTNESLLVAPYTSGSYPSPDPYGPGMGVFPHPMHPGLQGKTFPNLNYYWTSQNDGTRD